MKMIAAISVFAMSATLAVAAGKAGGTLTVSGQATSLAYSYARTQVDPGTQQTSTIVLLTDVELTDADAWDEAAKRSMVRSGRLHTVELTITPGTQGVQYRLGHKTFDRNESGRLDLAFPADAADTKALGGRAFTQYPMTGMGNTPYEFNVTFQTTVNN